MSTSNVYGAPRIESAFDVAARQSFERLVAGDPPTIVRSYPGKQQTEAVAAFESDARELAKRGYVPSAQSWAQGQWSNSAFAVAVLLCFVIVGIFVFIYMLVVKPDGNLTVTYRRHELASAPEAIGNATAVAPLTLATRLRQLDEARDAGLLSDAEHAKKRADILEAH